MSEVPKKKMKPLAWVGIGCGGLLLVGVVVAVLAVMKGRELMKENMGDFSDLKDNPEKFAAETMVKGNPDLTLIESNEEEGEITFKDKEGSEITLSYQDLAEGKLTVETQDGETTTTTTLGSGGLEKLPNWFAVPASMTSWKSIMHMMENGKSAGSVVGVSSLDVSATAAAFEKELANAGFAQESKMESGGSSTQSYIKESDGRSVSLIISSGEGGKVAVQMSYQEK